MMPFSERLHPQGEPNRLSHCCLSSRWVLVKKTSLRTTARLKRSSRPKTRCVIRDLPGPLHHHLQLQASRASKAEIDSSWRLSASGDCIPRCERPDRLDRG